ncbi:TKL/TKL-ccin protein kinase [Punctularia strigosozonata HHB-11173 SS5]|uniref:TKL/TKL-ccin protein kinase n=1 Tax=Punctularia strigosozonata (strain HHB-11173) TaxID=741275 RepID=R7S0C3_PUNST|nr:TKL/TKL-ccin protein kinase [Punctularia strigosozonata HHB-11173 SS5]EIN03835.1 TKL/TKL-ccin protein kinase [Punctularia strigosozonata HHB-11173 SS5]
MNAALARVESEILHIRDRMMKWRDWNTLKNFVKQKEIKEEIDDSNAALSACAESLFLTSHLQMHQMQSDFTAVHAIDRMELFAALNRLEAQGEETNNQVFVIMNSVQQEILPSLSRGDLRLTEILRLLFDLQTKYEQLLPNMNLNHGEVVRLQDGSQAQRFTTPVKGSANMDVYEGRYLDNCKVALKTIRSFLTGPKSLQRFQREVGLWQKVWSVDKGRHILPVYGYSEGQGHPFVVSPWQENGTVMDYTRKYDNQVDFRTMIKEIAEGIAVLHGMTPPVAHGDIKDNILISLSGHPLLSDFGLAKVIEDVTGAPITSTGSSNSARMIRWFAPELFEGDSTLNLSADIYAFGMTVLEIFTGSNPYSTIKRDTEVIIKKHHGMKPVRPTDDKTVSRGLDDNLWELLLWCWESPPAKRPTISQVLERL